MEVIGKVFFNTSFLRLPSWKLLGNLDIDGKPNLKTETVLETFVLEINLKFMRKTISNMRYLSYLVKICLLP